MKNYLVIVILVSLIIGLIGLNIAVRALGNSRYDDKSEIHAALLFLGSFTAFAVSIVFTLLWIQQLSIN